VLQEDVEYTILAQHYGILYYGRGHCGVPIPDQCYTAAAAYATVLEQVVVPNHHFTGLEVHLQVDSDAGCDVRASTVEAPPVSATSLGIAAGPQEIVISLAAVGREDLATTVRVEIQRAVGGTWASVESFFVCDADLAAVPV